MRVIISEYLRDAPAYITLPERGVRRTDTLIRPSCRAPPGAILTAKWNLDTEYIQSCNCEYGCPCNFNGRPSHGNCEALFAYNVRRGSVNGTNLEGVKFAVGAWWPKAIHEGNGTSRLYIDSKATPAQRKVVEELHAGKHAGGVFEIFPKTWAKILPTRAAKIDWKWSGYDSSFTVEGVGGVKSTHIKNPVTNDDFEGKILLPKGIAWKASDVSSVDWSLKDVDAGWNMKYEHRAGFVCPVKVTEKGPD